MSKTTLISALALSVAAMAPISIAAQADQPSLAWGRVTGGATSAGDQCTAIASSAAGDVYMLSTMGSTEAAPDIYVDGEYLFTGAPYNAGNSHANNLALIKFSPDGEPLWSVYSAPGEGINNEGGVAVGTDGNIYMASRVRHTDGMLSEPFTIHDAKGGESVTDWKITDGHRYNRLMINKVSPDGEVIWTRMVTFDTDPAPAASGNYATFTTEGFKVRALTLDPDCNIYLAGVLRKNARLTAADGSTVTVEARNTESWTGDPQTTCGSLYIFKFDSDGNYLDHFTTSGSATAENIEDLCWHDGRLYAAGFIIGNGSDVTVGQSRFRPQSAYNPLLICLSADLDVEWARLLTGEKIGGKHGYQNYHMALCGDDLYLSGQYNLKITDPDNPANSVESTQGNIREGFIIRLAAADGRWLAACNSRDDNWAAPNGITGYFNVIRNESHPGTVYAIGYVMNQNYGTIMRAYDAATLQGDTSLDWSLVNQGGVPTYLCCSYSPADGSLVTATRGNKAFRAISGEESKPTKSWDVYLSKFHLPEFLTSGVSEASADSASDISITAADGAIVILNPGEPAEIAVSDIAGRQVRKLTARHGETRVSLAPGVYIAAGRKVMVL